MSAEFTSKELKKFKEIIRKRSVAKDPIETGFEPQLSPLKNIKAVFFDVYGTILISGTEPMQQDGKERQIKAMQESFQAFGISMEPDVAKKAVNVLHKIIRKTHHKKKEEGKDYPEVDIIRVWIEAVRELEEEEMIGGFDFDDIPALVTEFVTRYDEPWLMPGLQSTLDSLQESDRLLGIISNSQFYSPLTLEALTEKSLEEMGFHPDLLFWSFSEDIAKPSVHFYEIASKKLREDYEIEPEEVLFVGNDMLNDVYPAAEAGFKTALFAGDQRSLRLRENDERCQNIEPDISITHLSQIPECLD
ncbi:HAD family hydrolase [Gracilimonas mengyeensis]|uniref:Putative hydrolase of the HAD superfamily n=1 Tax=Gracilimonas mengyeensis TaxID=1302730 RepID=A0A521BRP7_9BACT|nr:HAD family hydrolase [Gracilimonas mengyeensis]SMO49836.1 putative hydrolase of the HAD superfamily [Gracilimonas mengyeensis]